MLDWPVLSCLSSASAVSALATLRTLSELSLRCESDDVLDVLDGLAAAASSEACRCCSRCLRNRSLNESATDDALGSDDVGASLTGSGGPGDAAELLAFDLTDSELVRVAVRVPFDAFRGGLSVVVAAWLSVCSSSDNDEPIDAPSDFQLPKFMSMT